MRRTPSYARHWACASIALTITAAACGSSDNTSPGGGNGDGGVQGDDANTSSGGFGSDAAGGGSSGAGSSGAGSSGAGGSSGASGSGAGAGDGSAGSACPPYQALCGNQCIPVAIDPTNCGGCNVKCADPTPVCSGGACSGGCLPGTSNCSGSCVDTQTDNNNCGGCGKVCPMGQGCSSGACVPAVGKSSISQCVGGGPPIHLGSMTAGCLAQVTFPWALCSCKDVSCSDVLRTDGFDSTQGPYKPGGLGGGIGVDRAVSVSSLLDVGGTLWASASTGTSPSSQTTVRQDLHVGGPVSSSATFTVADDAYVDGNVSGGVTIGKTLYIPSGDTATGVKYQNLVNQPVSVPPPCDCTPQGLLPIASWIAAAKAKNDNALIGLTPNALMNPAGDIHLDLPCGSYYLTGISSGNSVTVSAHGNTALFIDGNASSDSGLSFVLDPTAQFDVVIGGTIQASSGLVIGSPNYPALSRTYIGSTATLDLSASGQIGGNVYAAYGPVSLSSDYVQYGSLFAGNFDATGSAFIHYDRATVGGKLCPPPTTTTTGDGGGGGSGGSSGAGSSGGSSSGGGGGGCGSCKDCNNQACINGSCAMCTSSAQCCPPLTCVGGTCELVLL